MTKARDLSKLLSTSNGKIAGSNLDVSFENITDTGTEGTKVASGTTAQRGSTAGQLRFNSTTGLAEYYDGSQFKSIDAPPSVSSISPSTALTANQDITITGSNFSTGVTVKFIGNDGTEYSSPTVTRNSASELVAETPSTVLTVANEPYDIQVTNTSGLTGILEDGLDAGSTPSFTTASGSIGTLADSNRAGSNLTTIVATDADSQSVTLSLKAGSSVPSGLTFNSNGTFSGTANSVGSDTTTTFTVVASDGTNTNERQFSITVNSPVTQTFSYTGSDQSWTAPSGVSSVNVWLWGAGGGADRTGTDYGGAGGYVSGTLAVTGGNDYVIVVGEGGAGGDNDANYTTAQPASYGGGGAGYENPSGGGLSGIFSGSGQVFNGYTPQPTDHSRTLVIAGGGGGADNQEPNGASGGYPNGGSPPAGVGASGVGGSQSAGGADGGGLLKGGSGYTGNRWTGGGGGGYYGGGTGQGNDSAGAGGSSYIDNLTNSSYNAGSTTQTPSGTSESTYGNNAGYGGQGVSGSSGQYNTTYLNGGFHGRVVIQY
jgi:hypothetical protein